MNLQRINAFGLLATSAVSIAAGSISMLRGDTACGLMFFAVGGCSLQSGLVVAGTRRADYTKLRSKFDSLENAALLLMYVFLATFPPSLMAIAVALGVERFVVGKWNRSGPIADKITAEMGRVTTLRGMAAALIAAWNFLSGHMALAAPPLWLLPSAHLICSLLAAFVLRERWSRILAQARALFQESASSREKRSVT